MCLVFIQSQASCEVLSICSRLVLPSLWISILAHAKEYTLLSISIPYRCSTISFAFSVVGPPASLIIFDIALVRKAPLPHAASRTPSFILISIRRHIREVICGGVNTCPFSDLPLYLLNSLKKMLITSSPFQYLELTNWDMVSTQSINSSIAC